MAETCEETCPFMRHLTCIMPKGHTDAFHKVVTKAATYVWDNERGTIYSVPNDLKVRIQSE